MPWGETYTGSTLVDMYLSESSGLSARTVAEKLGTSPAQLYRLLDPTNYNKSARQLLALLVIGGAAVTVSDARRPA
ncbi:MAG TPA: hypothetical protein VND44_06440 [Acidimicrobiales bacterium]|nr:hypothetical protein [Acidimicrobiales bacterium]